MFEANKAEILRRLEKIRKHLARIDEIIQCSEDETQDDDKNVPWYPPVPEGFGPWIEYDGTGRPVGAEDVTHVLCRIERMEQYFDSEERSARYWNWSHNSPEGAEGDQIVAYCVEN